MIKVYVGEYVAEKACECMLEMQCEVTAKGEVNVKWECMCCMAKGFVYVLAWEFLVLRLCLLGLGPLFYVLKCTQSFNFVQHFGSKHKLSILGPKMLQKAPKCTSLLL